MEPEYHLGNVNGPDLSRNSESQVYTKSALEMYARKVIHGIPESSSRSDTGRNSLVKIASKFLVTDSVSSYGGVMSAPHLRNTLDDTFISKHQVWYS